MLELPNVTLLGIDCVNVERLQKALDISSHKIKFANVKLLTSLSTHDSRKVEIPHINTIEEFSEFCIRDLYKYVDTDFVLLVQYDGFILNPESWEDDFLKCDYIGAPWLVGDWGIEHGHFEKELKGHCIVGNGGFCIRSKKFLEISRDLAHEGIIKHFHPEDVALCHKYRKEFEERDVKFAPVDLAHRFSIEGRDEVYERQFGFHGLKWTDITKWIDENPKWGIENNFGQKN